MDVMTAACNMFKGGLRNAQWLTLTLELQWWRVIAGKIGPLSVYYNKSD